MDKQKIITILDKIIEFAFYILIIAFTFSISFVDATIAVIVVGWLVKKIILKDFKFPRNSFLLVFVIFILWNALSIYNSNYLYESIRGLIKIIKYAQ